MDRLFAGAKMAFQDVELGRQHSGGWGSQPMMIQEKIVSLVGGRTYDIILDLGCGPGNYAFLLNGWSRYVAVDQSKVWLELAQKRLAFRKPGVEFHRSWIEDFEYNDRIDLLLCVDVFQHHAKPMELAEKLCEFDFHLLCLNLMVTSGKEPEDFLWDEWGKLSEGMTGTQAKAVVRRIEKLVPARVVGRSDLPYGHPLPQLTAQCYVLEKMR